MVKIKIQAEFYPIFIKSNFQESNIDDFRNPNTGKPEIPPSICCMGGFRTKLRLAQSQEEKNRSQYKNGIE